MAINTATLTNANLAQSYELVNLLRGEPLSTVLRRGFNNETPLQFMQMVNWENQRYSKHFSGSPLFEIYSVAEQVSNGFIDTRTVVGSTLELTLTNPDDVKKFRVGDVVSRNFMSSSQGLISSIVGNVITIQQTSPSNPFTSIDFQTGTELLRVGRKIRQFNTSEPTRLNIVPEHEVNYPSNIDDGGSSSYNENQKTVGIQWNQDGTMFYSTQVATAIERLMLSIQHNALNSFPNPWNNFDDSISGAKGIKYRIQFEGGAFYKNDEVPNTKADYMRALDSVYLNGANPKNTVMHMGYGARREFNEFFKEDIKYTDSIVKTFGDGLTNLTVQKVGLANGMEVYIHDFDLFNSKYAGTDTSRVAGYNAFTPTQMSTLIMDWSPAPGYNGGSVAAVQSHIFSSENVEFRVGVENGLIPIGGLGMQGEQLVSAIDGLSSISATTLKDGVSFRILASPRCEHLSRPETCAYVGVTA